MIDRRHFLALTALASIGSSSGCDFARRLAGFEDSVSRTGDRVATPMERLAQRVLDRFGYGPRPGDIARVVRSGVDAYLDEQLSPDSVDDSSTARRLRRIETLELAAEDLFAVTEDEALEDLRRGTLVRAVYSERQLFERVVEFWSDHFNIYGAKEGCGRLLVVHDREVIRRYALGSFDELLRAVLTSPAMLVFLDGTSSTAGNPTRITPESFSSSTPSASTVATRRTTFAKRRER